jgi:hypothetical protein
MGPSPRAHQGLPPHTHPSSSSSGIHVAVAPCTVSIRSARSLRVLGIVTYPNPPRPGDRRRLPLLHPRPRQACQDRDHGEAAKKVLPPQPCAASIKKNTLHAHPIRIVLPSNPSLPWVGSCPTVPAPHGFLTGPRAASHGGRRVQAEPARPRRFPHHMVWSLLVSHETWSSARGPFHPRGLSQIPRAYRLRDNHA